MALHNALHRPVQLFQALTTFDGGQSFFKLD